MTEYDKEIKNEQAINNGAILHRAKPGVSTPYHPRTIPVPEEQFQMEIKADRLRELQISLYQAVIAITLLLLGVVYSLYL